MNIGYVRVSANHQNLDRQIALLKRARCKQIFKEKRSGREGIKRPHQEREAVRMVCLDGQSLRVVARHYHVGHSTIVRALERANSIA
jgi:DNA invertase Pin-like site-specific DNA recombinase